MAQVASAGDSRFDYLTRAGDSERKKVMDEYQRWSQEVESYIYTED